MLCNTLRSNIDNKMSLFLMEGDVGIGYFLAGVGHGSFGQAIVNFFSTAIIFVKVSKTSNFDMHA